MKFLQNLFGSKEKETPDATITTKEGTTLAVPTNLEFIFDLTEDELGSLRKFVESTAYKHGLQVLDVTVGLGPQFCFSIDRGLRERGTHRRLVAVLCRKNAEGLYVFTARRDIDHPAGNRFMLVLGKSVPDLVKEFRSIATTSRFAGQLRCAYCSKPNAPTTWPLNGDMTPFYNQTNEQTDETPGAYRVMIHCDHCGKDWFVVWDKDPSITASSVGVTEQSDIDPSVARDFYALALELIQIGHNEGYLKKGTWEAKNSRIREIGAAFNEKGGLRLMHTACAKVNKECGQSLADDLEKAWHGIGDWQM